MKLTDLPKFISDSAVPFIEEKEKEIEEKATDFLKEKDYSSFVHVKLDDEDKPTNKTIIGDPIQYKITKTKTEESTKIGFEFPNETEKRRWEQSDIGTATLSEDKDGKMIGPIKAHFWTEEIKRFIRKIV